MSPAPALLERLATTRFRVTHARPSVGTGERRSALQGAGMEFSTHRPYHPGDDVKHLDIRVKARLGENYVRQYFIYRQLPITVVVDASASMATGSPAKFALARTLLQLSGFVAIAGGDRVRLGAFRDGQLSMSGWFQGVARTRPMLDWAERIAPSGRASFREALRQLVPELPGQGLLVLISDWWTDDISEELALLAEARQEVFAFHVASPEELDPGLLGEGSVRLSDVESGEEIELVLDRGTVADYARAYESWARALEQRFTRWAGRYFRISSASDAGDFFLRRLRAAGVLT